MAVLGRAVPPRRADRRRAGRPRAGAAADDDPQGHLPRGGRLRRPPRPRDRRPGRGRHASPSRAGRPVLADRKRRDEWLARQLRDLTPEERDVLRAAAPIIQTTVRARLNERLVSPTFRALRNPNYRLYLAGSVVSNTGTWMQRVAQDWLVLSLPGTGGTELGITTGLQFLPVLLLVAVRRRDRRPVPQARPAPAHPAGHGGLRAAARADRRQRPRPGVAGLRAGLRLRHRRRPSTRPARQSFVSEMVGRDDLTNAVGLNSASFNVARLMGPAAAGLLIGAARRRRPGLGLGDPAQRGCPTSR